MKPGRDEGFTLMELSIALSLVALLSVFTVPLCLRMISIGRLSYTTSLLLYQFRYAQEAARTIGPNGSVKLSMYTPAFQTLVGTRCVGTYTFAPGIDYKDGYLQLNTGRVMYDVYGNAQVGGTIRITSGQDEQDISLYIGTGLVTASGASP